MLSRLCLLFDQLATGAAEKLAKLVRFATTAGAGEAQTVSLAEYAGRMKEGQKAIYYVTADTFAGAVPTILKLNSANTLSAAKDQALTGSVEDALRLGCSAVGFSTYWPST